MTSLTLLSDYLAGRRTLDPEEARRLREAEQLLRQAQQQADTLVREAHAEAQQVREQARVQAAEQSRLGYSQGWAAAQRDHARSMASASAERARAITSNDERMGLIVTRTLAKVLSERDNDERFFDGVMSKVLQATREEKFLTVRVNPTQVDAARQSVNRALADSGAPQFVDVLRDAALARGACVVESEHGVLDASLDIQLEAIRAALSTVWRGDDV